MVEFWSPKPAIEVRTLVGPLEYRKYPMQLHWVFSVERDLRHVCTRAGGGVMLLEQQTSRGRRYLLFWEYVDQNN